MNVKGKKVALSLKAIYARCTTSGDCKLWKGGLSTNGYPYIHCPEKYSTHKGANGYGGASRSGRRVVWKIKHGTEASGTVIMTCGNKLCLNHAHMRDGTRQDVQLQASQEGKLHTVRRRVALAAITLQHAKLDHVKAAEIRRMLQGYAKGRQRRQAWRDIGAIYGVSEWCIRDIDTGKSWTKAAQIVASSVWAYASNAETMRQAA